MKHLLRLFLATWLEACIFNKYSNKRLHQHFGAIHKVRTLFGGRVGLKFVCFCVRTFQMGPSTQSIMFRLFRLGKNTFSSIFRLSSFAKKVYVWSNFFHERDNLKKLITQLLRQCLVTQIHLSNLAAQCVHPIF